LIQKRVNDLNIVSIFTDDDNFNLYEIWYGIKNINNLNKDLIFFYKMNYLIRNF